MDPAVKWPMTAFSFGEFKFSIATQQLRGDGQSTRLQMQPAKVLHVLLSRAGEIVTREELRRELWSEGIHVDFDDALNHSIKYLRDALHDDAAMPRYIETIPRRGYRFISPVSKIAQQPADVSTQPPGVEVPSNRPRRANLVAWAVAVVTVAALAAGAWWRGAEASAPRAINAVRVTHFGLASAVVTDGMRLYIEQEQGAHHTLVTAPADGSSDPVALPTPFPNTNLLDISPDGKELLIASFDAAGNEYALWRLPLAGGSPRRVGNVYAGSAKWSPDEKWIAFGGHSDGQKDALYVTNSEGSELIRIAQVNGQIDSWSADAKWIRFTTVNDSTGGMKMWEAATAGTNEVHPLLPERENNQARWGEGQCCGRSVGKYLIFREGDGNKVALWALREDSHWLGKPQASELYAAGFDIDGHVPPALDSNGRRLFFVGRAQSQELMLFENGKKQFVPYLPTLSARFFSWSPDGRSLAYVSGPDLILWRSNADGSQRVQLTYPPMQAFEPRWSPDEKHLVFHTLSPGQPGKVAIISAAGGTLETLAADQPSGEDSQTWAPDGNAIMFSRASFDSMGNVQSRSIWTLDLRTHRESRLPGSDGYVSPKWSPDGHYAVAQTDDGHELVLFDFQTSKWKRLASGASLQPPHWSHDGSAVFYQDLRISEDQPIYRVMLASGRIDRIAGRKQILSSDVARCLLAGLTLNDEPVVRVIHNNADIYRLDIELP